MKTTEIYNELERFYKYRGDKVAYSYLKEFLKRVTSEKIPIHDYVEWFENNKESLNPNLKTNTLKSYNSILNQFIRYISAVEEINIQTGKLNETKETTHKTVIYDNFNDFNKSKSKIKRSKGELNV